MTIKEFIVKYGIAGRAQKVAANPNMDGMPQDSSHYIVTMERNGKKFSTPYSMGPAHNRGPQTADVLNCIASDVSGYDSARNFEDWAANYGYDTDSRKAERIYNIIAEQSKSLKNFLGETGYKELCEEVERL